MIPFTVRLPLESVQEKWFFSALMARELTRVTLRARNFGTGFSWPKGASMSSMATVSSVSSSSSTHASTSTMGRKSRSGS